MRQDNRLRNLENLESELRAVFDANVGFVPDWLEAATLAPVLAAQAAAADTALDGIMDVEYLADAIARRMRRAS